MSCGNEDSLSAKNEIGIILWIGFDVLFLKKLFYCPLFLSHKFYMTPYFLLCHKKLPQTSWFKKNTNLLSCSFVG